MPLADNIKGLQQRDARFQHGRQLASEQRYFFVASSATASEPLLFDRINLDSLPPQGGVDLRFTVGTYLAAHGFARFVFAGPQISGFLDDRAFSWCRCSSHQFPLLFVQR